METRIKGLKIKYSGSFSQIVMIVFSELLPRLSLIDLDKTIYLMKEIHKFMYDNVEFHDDWNEEIAKRLTEIGKRLQKNPLVV